MAIIETELGKVHTYGEGGMPVFGVAGFDADARHNGSPYQDPETTTVCEIVLPQTPECFLGSTAISAE